MNKQNDWIVNIITSDENVLLTPTKIYFPHTSVP